MARAKKTDRAEARRRARAEAQSAAPEGADDGAAATGTGTAGSGAAGVRGGPPTRSIFGAFRAAIRPFHLRDDLQNLPWLVVRTKAVWAPSAIIVASAVWFAVGGGNGRDLSGLVFNLFVFPPPLAAAFLAGILTDRMSYLAGLLVGLVAAVVFSVYMLFGPIIGADLSGTAREGYVLYALAVSPLSGLAIGGFAGFYRRFLRLANPNAGPRQTPRGKGSRPSKAAARR